MAVNFENLTRDRFKEMGFRETVQEIPGSFGRDGEPLTKLQIATLALINNADVHGFAQIRDFNARTTGSGVFIPSESVPQTLEEKGFVSIRQRKQVARRTGRTSSGFETKLEGGHIRVTANDELDMIAEQLGFDSRFDDDFIEFARDVMQNHPRA